MQPSVDEKQEDACVAFATLATEVLVTGVDTVLSVCTMLYWIVCTILVTFDNMVMYKTLDDKCIHTHDLESVNEILQSEFISIVQYDDEGALIPATRFTLDVVKAIGDDDGDMKPLSITDAQFKNFAQELYGLGCTIGDDVMKFIRDKLVPTQINRRRDFYKTMYMLGQNVKIEFKPVASVPDLGNYKTPSFFDYIHIKLMDDDDSDEDLNYTLKSYLMDDNMKLLCGCLGTFYFKYDDTEPDLMIAERIDGSDKKIEHQKFAESFYYYEIYFKPLDDRTTFTKVFGEHVNSLVSDNEQFRDCNKYTDDERNDIDDDSTREEIEVVQIYPRSALYGIPFDYVNTEVLKNVFGIIEALGYRIIDTNDSAPPAGGAGGPAGDAGASTAPTDDSCEYVSTLPDWVKDMIKHTLPLPSAT